MNPPVRRTLDQGETMFPRIPGLGRSKHTILLVRWDRMLAVRLMLVLSDREEISSGLAEGLQYEEIDPRCVLEQ